MPRYHQAYGRVFEVQAFKTDEAANIFMSANPGYGVLAVVDGEVLCAPCESQGVALGEVPFAVRQALEVSHG